MEWSFYFDRFWRFLPGSEWRFSPAANNMRYAIDNKKFYPINRRKNLDTLAHLGISWDAAKEEIYDLKEEDYKSGPSVDRDDPSSDHFWVFKKKVDGNSIYIKFKVLYQKDGGVRVVSFHIDEY